MIFRFMRKTALLCCLVAMVWTPALADDNPEGTTRNTTLFGPGTNYGTIDTNYADGYGIFTNSGTASNNGTITTSGNSGHGIFGLLQSTIYNHGTITITGQDAYGIYAVAGASAYNYGTITTTGLRANGLSASGAMSKIYNYGTVTVTGTDSSAMDVASSGKVYNYGAVNASGTNTHGIRVQTGGTAYNYGAVNASGANNYGIILEGGTARLYNAGTISSADSHAIHAQGTSSVYLLTGTNILNGSVYGEAGSNLFLDGTGTVNFVIDGEWADITKTGSGTWTFAQDFGALTASTNLNLNGGTLAVAEGVTLNVTGNYVQAAGATLLVTPDGVATPLVVSGTATLVGSLLVDGLADGASATVLTALGGVSNTFDSVSSGNPSYSMSTVYGGNSVTVTSIYAPKYDIPSTGVDTTLAGARDFAGVASTRGFILLAERDRDETESNVRRAERDGGENEDGQVMVASAGSLTGFLNRPQAPDNEPRWGVYAQPMFGSSSRDATNGLGYDARMYGFEMGIDRFVADNVLVGVMGGYATTHLDFKGSTFVENDHEDQNMYTLGAYAGWGPENWHITDVLSASLVKHDSSRNAGLGQTAKADYSSWLATNELRVAYVWVPIDRWEITPRLELDTIHVSRGGFSETGAANALRYDDFNKTFWEGVAAVRATRSFMAGDMTISPFAGLGYSRDLSNNDVTVRQYLPTTSAEVTTTNDKSRMTAECGLTLVNSPGKVTLAYHGEYSKNSHFHGLDATLRWEF